MLLSLLRRYLRKQGLSIPLLVQQKNAMSLCTGTKNGFIQCGMVEIEILPAVWQAYGFIKEVIITTNRLKLVPTSDRRIRNLQRVHQRNHSLYVSPFLPKHTKKHMSI